jgi:hypothetical protein
MYNMYAMDRNSKKFAKRDKRVNKSQHIEFDNLAPDTAEEILHGMELLKGWIKRAEGGPVYAEGMEKVLLEVLDYKTNATWADILMLSREDNFPLLTEDFYGKGRLLILNVPENFADLYQLPGEVIETICAEISRGQSCYLAAEPKWSLITYDNEAVCVHSFRPMPSQAGLVVRGSCRGIRNLSTGEIITDCVRKNAPRHRGDAAMTRSAEDEFEFTVRAGAGQSVYLKILR